LQTAESRHVEQLLRKCSTSLKRLNEDIGTTWANRRKPMGIIDHRDMCRFLREEPIDSIQLVGRGIHRPWQLGFDNGYKVGLITCDTALFKTIRSIEETNYYKKSTDRSVTSPERELAAYALDRALQFNLVPPTVWREVFDLGYGVVQAWVSAPLAIDWYESGYDYRKDYENPWLHLLCAFDFIIGSLDRHAANWIIDTFHRVYAIDNGYSFVKDDYREWFKCNVGRRFKDQPIHPLVKAELDSIDPQVIPVALRPFGFRCGEIEGAMTRLSELKGKKVWDIEDGRWSTS